MSQQNAINQYSELLSSGSDGTGEAGEFTASDTTTAVKSIAIKDNRNSYTCLAIANDTTDTNSGSRIELSNGADGDGQRSSGGIGVHSKDYTYLSGLAGRVAIYANTSADGLALTFSDSQDLRIQTNDAVSEYAIFRGAGEVSLPLQPCFLAINSSTDSNVTGDGTVVSPVEFNSEVFDQNSDYDNSTDTFTAPVTGIYLFKIAVYITDLTSSHTDGYLRLTTSNREYYVTQVSPYATSTASNAYLFQGTVIADMDASDTANVKCGVIGGTKVVDVFGSASPITYFSGNLLC